MPVITQKQTIEGNMEPEDSTSKQGNSGREWNFKKYLTEEEHGVKTLGAETGDSGG